MPDQATQHAIETDRGHAAHTMAHENQTGLPGKFYRPIKVAMLGAGSHFTHAVVNDLLCIHGADQGTITLVDIDPARLTPMVEIARKLTEAHNKPGWTINAATNHRDALKGCDYLINCIDVGGVECVRSDNDIPLKYGVDQCIGDTIGPGGIFKALRTGPVWLSILRDAEEICPDAWVFNYTNPMNILTLLGNRGSWMKNVGLCHAVQYTTRMLAKQADIPYEELTYDCAGINHLAFFTQLSHKGQDLNPVLLEKAFAETSGGIYDESPVRYDLMKHFGYFAAEHCGHISEYLPYYRPRKDDMAAHCQDGYKGESSFYANNWPTWRKQQDAHRDAMLAGKEEIVVPRSFEYAAWIIEAIEKDQPTRFFGNVINNQDGQGPLITNLPTDGCVELACYADGTGIRPTRYGKLPAQLAGLCSSNMAVFELAATAVLEQSKEAAIHALMLDPLTAACTTPRQIVQMAEEMFGSQQSYLGSYL